MSTISLSHISKEYKKGTRTVEDFSLEIGEHEFVVLVGPSGCGKSTLLRMIAGLEEITEGELWIDDRLMNSLPSGERKLAMVFQNYALYPNMTVRKNISFGLESERDANGKKLPRTQIRQRVDRAADMLGLSELMDRRPSQLSGGQKQRVAIGSAIVQDAKAYLMDEPLSNLDAKLRVEMRTAIKEIQNSVGITTVYVTHDQEEAMAVSDRIAVMNGGVIQHVGTPKNIYQRPANTFVATFIGRSNILQGEMDVEGGRAVVSLPTGYKAAFDTVAPENLKKQPVILCARPEELIVETTEGDGLKAVIDSCVFLGLNTHYFVHLLTGEKAEIIQESSIDSIIQPGTQVRLRLNTEKANLFTQDGSRNLLTGVENDLAKEAV